MAAVAYGHVAIVPKGIWNADTQYEVCHLVEYDGSSYVAKAQPPVGTLPTDTSYWQVSAAGTKKASSGSLGTVMPDGSTTEVNEAGKLSAKTAQQDAVGVVKGSDDITVGEDGNLTVNTEFEQATELANLIAGEAIKSVLGKVSKAIAATMNLDQNALLKNMISGIDVNSGEKVPSSAFVHTLYERLGMGTDLSAGDAENVTQAVNALYSNIAQTNTVAVTSKINTTYGTGTMSYHTAGKVCFVYFVFTPNQKCDNVELLASGVLPKAQDTLYRSVSTWGNPSVAVSLLQIIFNGSLRFWCGESAVGMQIFDSFSYCIR
jgi:hypothetical protein|nr:MAG TPA: hypothetical protein [Caudoviricetes sp.]